MLLSNHTRLPSLLGALLFALICSGCGTSPRGVAPSHGIPNFARVNDALFRGAQPDKTGIANLRRLGVRTIINLRQPSDTWLEEESVARANGLIYVSVPMSGLRAPTDAQVAQVLALIDSGPSPVFVHCEHGADRTGTIVACYRIQHDGWTVERAIAETETFGFSPFEVGMRNYILAFPQAGLRRHDFQ